MSALNVLRLRIVPALMEPPTTVGALNVVTPPPLRLAKLRDPPLALKTRLPAFATPPVRLKEDPATVAMPKEPTLKDALGL